MILLCSEAFSGTLVTGLPVDPKTLPEDPKKLIGIIVDLTAQLDRESTEKRKYADMLRELLEAERARKSERLSKEQLALFEAAWNAREDEEAGSGGDGPDGNDDGEPGAGSSAGENAEAGLRQRAKPVRRPLAAHLTRERIVHDLAEADKHCACCGKDLRLIDEATSERYEYTPASLKVIEDVRRPRTQTLGQPCPG